MIELTPAARRLLSEHFQKGGRKPLRISLLTGGCGFDFFGIGPAEKQGKEFRFDSEGFTFFIDPRLIEKYAPIKVDSDGYGFFIHGRGIQPPYGCGTCAFGCSIRSNLSCTGDCQSCSTPCIAGKRALRRRNRQPAAVNYMK